MQTPEQKSYTTYNIILAVVLFALTWATASLNPVTALVAEQSPTGFLGQMIGATIAPFILATVILLLLRLFGKRWNNQTFFYLALVFSIISLILRLSARNGI